MLNIRKVIRLEVPRLRKSWKDAPTWLLWLFVFNGALQVAVYGHIFTKFGPGFFDLANSMPLAHWTDPAFIVCAILLLAIGAQSILWSVITAGPLAVLQKRISPSE